MRNGFAVQTASQESGIVRRAGGWVGRERRNHSLINSIGARQPREARICLHGEVPESVNHSVHKQSAGMVGEGGWGRHKVLLYSD